MLIRIIQGFSFLFLLSFVGCSSSPKYLDEQTIHEKNVIKKEIALSNETVVLSPHLENPRLRKFEYLLTNIPPKVKINKVILRLGIAEKVVWARSLGGATAAELSLIVVPTPFYGSRMKVKGVNYSYAVNSTIKFDTSAMSIFERVGGTGGKAAYYSQGAGFDEWDVTDSVKYGIKQHSPFTFKLGIIPADLLDQTIFSHSYNFGRLVLDKLKDTNTYSKLTVYYE